MIRLYRVEIKRLLARRLVRALLLLLLIGTATVLVIIAVHSNRNLAAAHARAAALARQIAQGGPAGGPGGGKVICVQNGPGNGPCQTPTAAQLFVDPRWYFAANGAALVGGGILAVGLLGLLIGATDIGAEWSAGTFTALLSWEPRRMRVLAAKMMAAVTVMVGVGVVAVAVNLGAGWLIADTRGSIAHTTSGLVTALVLRALRGLVIVGLLTMLGTAIAGLTRHTAAALGAAVAYLVGFELVLQHVHPEWNRWLLTSNAIAFLNDRNQEVFGRSGFFAQHPFVLSAHRGLLFLAIVVALIVAAHAVTLVRRDAI